MVRGARAEVELPSPFVRFGPDFRARLGRLLARLAAARERREGAGRAQFFGTGSEFVGYRPYRSGEDLRALDWNLYARLGRPYVRVSAREASEEWAVLVDASASMGVGVPGKWQLAAEFALAVAALGVARRAAVTLWLPGDETLLTVRKRGELERWSAAFEARRAQGSDGLASLVARAARGRGAGRLFLVGDFLDLDGQALYALARPSRELFLVQILAREELAPRAGPVRWIDAESGQARALLVDEVSGPSYERRLSARLERLRREATRLAARHGVWTSDTPFETLVQRLCSG